MKMDILARANQMEENSHKFDNAPAYPSLDLQPTEMHKRLVEVLVEILSLVQRSSSGDGSLPAPMRAAVRSIKHLEPVILEELSHVPESEISRFLDELVAKLQYVNNAPDRAREA